jgi:hypothetical protein
MKISLPTFPIEGGEGGLGPRFICHSVVRSLLSSHYVRSHTNILMLTTNTYNIVMCAGVHRSLILLLFLYIGTKSSTELHGRGYRTRH